MDFRLLGPFEARHDGQRIQVGRRRQERCLLGILLLQAGRAVPIDRVVDLLWDGDAPASVRLPVHAAAWSAAQLLADPRRYTIRVCPDQECGWLFLDHSGMRKWCSTQTCGKAQALRGARPERTSPI